MKSLANINKILQTTLSILLTVALMLSACDVSLDIDESDIYFPAAESASLGYPMATIHGTLIFDGKYLLIRTEYLDTFLIIWPYGYSVNSDGDEIQILDESDQVVAHVGDFIIAGGGETSKEVVEENYIRASLPDDYEGPYWLTFEVEVIE